MYVEDEEGERERGVKREGEGDEEREEKKL